MDFETRIRDILIGLAIGVILVYVLIKPKQQQVQQTLSSQSYPYHQSTYIDNHEDIYNGMDQISSGLSSISSRLRMLESRISSIPAQTNVPVQFAQTNPTTGSYKNNEKWIITRDKTGHIDSLEIARDAKIGK